MDMNEVYNMIDVLPYFGLTALDPAGAKVPRSEAARLSRPEPSVPPLRCHDYPRTTERPIDIRLLTGPPRLDFRGSSNPRIV